MFHTECLPLMADYLEACFHRECPEIHCVSMDLRCQYTPEQEAEDRRKCVIATTAARCPQHMHACLSYLRTCHCAFTSEDSMRCQAAAKIFSEGCATHARHERLREALQQCDDSYQSCMTLALAALVGGPIAYAALTALCMADFARCQATARSRYANG